LQLTTEETARFAAASRDDLVLWLGKQTLLSRRYQTKLNDLLAAYKDALVCPLSLSLWGCFVVGFFVSFPFLFFPPFFLLFFSRLFFFAFFCVGVGVSLPSSPR
jgi:hypothetical protein